MTPPPTALVGNAAARAVHGLTAGADLALIGEQDASGLRAELAGAGLSGAPTVVGGPGCSVLEQLADLAESDPGTPLVVAAADLEMPLAAVLDLLDKPGVGTGALTALPAVLESGREAATPARVGGDGALVESVGTARHTVTAPNRALPGLLRVSAADRSRAASLWRAGSATSVGWDVDGFALAVLALVRGGLPVQAVALGPFTWARDGVRGAGAAGGPWRQRLRGSSRGGDGFYSTYAVRPLSRRLTGVGLRLGWSPNVVTVTSLLAGVLAALLVATDNRWAWVAAAVLIQLALVVDCVDGEIARFTRRFSALGAWLDAVGDRVKEYSVFAACAYVGVRHGADLWLVAVAAMAVVTLRHLEDDAYGRRLRPSRLSRPDGIPLERERDLGPEGARTSFAPEPDARARRGHWARNIMHMPIGERYLLISLALLTFSPQVVLWSVIVAVGASMIWTVGGHTAKAVTGRDGVAPEHPGPGAGWGPLDHQADLGPLARLGGRLMRVPFLSVAVTGALLVVAVVLAARTDLLWVAFAAAVVAALLLGAATRPPVHHTLAWQLPWLLWVAEVLVLAVVVQDRLPVRDLGVLFAFLAAVAYHRYDTIYRLRDTGEAPPRWLSTLGLGVDGRIVLVTAVAALAPSLLEPLLAAGAAYLAALYLTESTVGWRRWIRSAGEVGDDTEGGAAA